MQPLLQENHVLALSIPSGNCTHRATSPWKKPRHDIDPEAGVQQLELEGCIPSEDGYVEMEMLRWGCRDGGVEIAHEYYLLRRWVVRGFVASAALYAFAIVACMPLVSSTSCEYALSIDVLRYHCASCPYLACVHLHTKPMHHSNLPVHSPSYRSEDLNRHTTYRSTPHPDPPTHPFTFTLPAKRSHAHMTRERKGWLTTGVLVV